MIRVPLLITTLVAVALLGSPPTRAAGDLTIGFESLQAGATVGSTIFSGVWVRNDTSSASGNVMLTVSIDSGLEEYVVSDGRCTVSGAALSCVLGSLAPASKATVAVSVRGTAPGTALHRIEATDGTTSGAWQGSAALYDPATLPDLVASFVSASAATGDADLEVVWKIENRGVSADSIRISVARTRDGVTNVSIAVSGGPIACDPSEILCQLDVGALAGGESVTVVHRVRVAPGATVGVQVYGRATSAPFDRNFADNELSYPVVAPTPPPAPPPAPAPPSEPLQPATPSPGTQQSQPPLNPIAQAPSCAGPWSRCSGDVGWLRGIVRTFGYRVKITDGALLIVHGRRGGRVVYRIWTAPERPRGKALQVVARRRIFGGGMRVAWRAQGRTVWLQQRPPAAHLARFVRATLAVPRR